MHSEFRPPDEATTLDHYPWVVIRFRCRYCARSRDARLARCAAKFGSHVTIGELLRIFVAGCQWNPHDPRRKPQKYGPKCGAYCPDIGKDMPPDLPPTAAGFTVIEGGRDQLLPAEPPKTSARSRRAG